MLTIRKVPTTSFLLSHLKKNNINFGLVDKAEGEKRFEFRFVNSGNAPLVLTYVHASCSCVRLEYPRQPIAPGDSSFIAGRLNPATIHETDFKRSILCAPMQTLHRPACS